MITLIGDVHGKISGYLDVINSIPFDARTIQLGDMALGFKGVALPVLPANHKWIRGNHDDPAKCRAHPNYLGDYGFLKEDGLFYLAGAFSIDRAFRVSGYSWWPDEEQSWEELQKAIDLYMEVKPRYVISHDAPSEAGYNLLTRAAIGFRPEKLSSPRSRTAEALQVMFDAFQPKEWVFGHYHIDKSFLWRGTKFTCVNELSTYQLETYSQEIGMTAGLVMEK